MNRDDYRIPACHCPDCGNLVDSVTPVTGARNAQPGDISVCLDCGHVSVFDAELILRNPTDEEIIEIAGDLELLAAQKARARYLATVYDKGARNR